MSRQSERDVQVHLLRCIVNPFHPVTLTPSTTIVQLAQAAYDERMPRGELDPARIAVLADALEESGAEEELVQHLRGQGPHVRGCRAVDACLGKV